MTGRVGTGGRVGIVAAMIVAIVLAGIARDRARAMRVGPNDVAAGLSGSSSLANMNSFALALLLGGLRGPLVMFLWTSSENLKNEKNLEDFDTYVEWIRLLQPEFDTVHIFQVWNKAYNISVQMASRANKYTTILDALDYAHRVEEARPNNISMLYQIGSIYGDKLGGASEKDYYKKRVREETQPHAMRQKLARNDPGWRRLELDPMLDANGMILPELLKPKYGRPSSAAAGSEWSDGSELQYLAPYQPFPYGISALALGYNYQKRAQVLQDVSNQVHANLSPMVLDSRPALAMKAWSEDESERARRLELKALNLAAPEERKDMDLPTANIALDTPLTDRSVLPEAIFSYDVSARVAKDAVVEYERHLKNYPSNIQNYQSHMDTLRAQEALYTADRDYLKAMMTPAGAQREALLKSAADHYREAQRIGLYIILRWYVNDDVAARVFPAGVARSDIASKIPAAQYPAMYESAMKLVRTQRFDADAEDRSEYEHYVDRAQARLKRIGG
jgi:hypothetical protein